MNLYSLTAVLLFPGEAMFGSITGSTVDKLRTLSRQNKRWYKIVSRLCRPLHFPKDKRLSFRFQLFSYLRVHTERFSENQVRSSLATSASLRKLIISSASYFPNSTTIVHLRGTSAGEFEENEPIIVRVSNRINQIRFLFNRLIYFKPLDSRSLSTLDSVKMFNCSNTQNTFGSRFALRGQSEA